MLRNVNYSASSALSTKTADFINRFQQLSNKPFNKSVNKFLNLLSIKGNRPNAASPNEKTMADLTIGIGNDHAGFPLKNHIVRYLQKKGYEVRDYGTNSEESVDYTDYAHPLAADISSGKLGKGILICGSGNGISMTANKHPHVRCALCWKEEIARLARQHNDANILSMPGRFVTEEEAERIVDAFLDTPFEGGRHQKRIDKIDL